MENEDDPQIVADELEEAVGSEPLLGDDGDPLDAPPDDEEFGIPAVDAFYEGFKVEPDGTVILPADMVSVIGPSALRHQLATLFGLAWEDQETPADEAAETPEQQAAEEAAGIEQHGDEFTLPE